MFGDFIKRKRYQNFGSEIKLSQFADDTNLFCADAASAERALETMNAFGDFSGFSFNSGQINGRCHSRPESVTN